MWHLTFQRMGRNLLLIMTLIAVMLSLSARANAQSNGLSVSTHKQYTIQPGQKVSDTLFIANLNTTQPLYASLKVIDFKAGGENGVPQLMLASNAPQTLWSLKSFINLPPTITVPPGKSAYIPFTLSIPAHQGAGSYYSAIEFTSTGGSQQRSVVVGATGVTLVFVTVPGKVSELMRLAQFGAYQASSYGADGSFASWFFTSKPKEVAFKLTNNGNVAEQPSGSIFIKNLFGHQVAAIDQANPNNDLALIGQTRRFDACIIPETKNVTDSSGLSATETVCRSPKLSPGRYTAKLAIFYGQNGNPTQQIVATSTFWYLPLWFVGIILALLAIAVFGTKLVARKIRRIRHRRPKDRY